MECIAAPKLVEWNIYLSRNHIVDVDPTTLVQKWSLTDEWVTFSVAYETDLY